MAHYTNIYSKAFFSAFLSILLISLSAHSQNCQPGYVLNPVTTNNNIEWSKFPEFSLPFKMIYSGPRFGDTQSQPLKHGFNHLAAFSGPEPGSLQPSQLAALWYAVATSSGNQPWADNTLRSPWGNDTAAYRSYWDAYASTITNLDVVCLDIERMQREDRDILALKSNTQIPQNYRNLSDADFIAAYKRDIRWWYTEAANRLRLKGVKAALTSYSDVPIRNTWLNITTNSWQDWTTNLARTHYLVQDNAGKIGGSFYNAMDFLSPSPYYYYGYDHPIGKDYLSYLLFSIEVNAAWSDKPIIPFVWLRVHDSYDKNTPLITNFMAEATAIFPFFSGAKGLWLWENPFISAERQENYTPYEHFIYGLYRLSQFKDMLEGNYQLVIPMPARDNMEQQNPVWRGIVKGNNILIAAQNPYADDNATTSITVSYQNWARNITLKGKEVFLCKFDLNDSVNGVEPSLDMVNVYPNPAAQELNVALAGVNGVTDVDFALTNSKGQIFMQQKLKAFAGETKTTITLPKLSAGMYFARFTTDNRTVIKKVVILQ
ncbi:Por secretion system C-terminal sorting domain-containing protein [Dyadobacter soli]|uniref:Por secretion system C-terminal sorting domain-containing protein n=1 Tax=Dyadobacter soli TaxID=659014 RepID=A0A1G6YGX4_9BACT|nr:T9SS type A sorting domain-containing protein [Dyadobacter soli]SDD88865.1 Por secretion system C-terminal sorting domain-containing protein [Dyadobacter soli]